MKISNIGNAYGIYNKKPAVSRKKTSVDETYDNFNVSDEARDFQTVLKAVSSTPEIREDKVNAIKKQIDNGTYNVSAEDIAEKMASWLA